MNFNEARQELKALTNNEHRALYYSLTEHSDGRMVAECRVYSDGVSFTGKCWEQALRGFKLTKEIANSTMCDESEMPK